MKNPRNRMNRLTFTLFALICSGVLFFGSTKADAQQVRDGQLQYSQMFRMAEGFVRVAEPGQIADTLNIWGDVSLPGRYMVPRKTNVADLISFARGPMRFQTGETQLDWSRVRLDIAVSRFDPEFGEQAFRFRYDYNQPMPEGMRDFTLQNNDLISIQTRRKPIFIDYVRVIAPTLSIILSTILIYDRFSSN
jgi:hypothetical protein